MKEVSEEKMLQAYVVPYQKVMNAAIETLQVEDVSNYAIFVGYFDQVPVLGIPLVNGDEYQNPLSLRLTTLEELTTKNVISSEKVDDFIKVYKEHTVDYCLLMFDVDESKFFFIPPVKN